MAIATLTYGTLNSVSISPTTSTPASGGYDTSTAYDCTTNTPLDVEIECVAGIAASTTGNKQVVLYLLASIDGTNYSTGPSSTSDTTHDSSMYFLGVIPTNGGASTETVRKTFTVAPLFGGVLPAKFKIVLKNDTGFALTSLAYNTREIKMTIA